METEETLLVRFARTQDQSALEAIMKQRWSEAYRIAARILRDPGAAEDAAQDAFVNLVRSAGEFDGSRRFGPWFQTLVVNAARNVDRSRRRRAQREEEAAQVRPTTAGSHAEDVAVAREIEGKLGDLAFELRAPLVLHYYEGHSHDEVASLLGVPKTTARSKIRRGLEQLREALEVAGSPCVLADLERWFEGASAQPLGYATPARPTPSSIVARASRAKGLSPRASLAAKALAALAGVGLALGLALGPGKGDGGERPPGTARAPGSAGTAAAGEGETGATPADSPRAQPDATPVPTSGDSGAKADGATRRPARSPATGSESPPPRERVRVTLRGRVRAPRLRALELAYVALDDRAARAAPDAASAFAPGVAAPSADPRAGISAVTRVEREGAFETGAFLAPDAFHVEARALGYGVVESSLEVGAVDSATIPDLVLGRGGSVSGRVTAPGGVPISGAAVVLADAEGRPRGFGLADATGSYRIEGVPAGEWAIAVVGQGAGAVKHLLESVGARVRVGAASPRCRVPSLGEAALGDVALEARVLAGRVFGVDGQPVAGATVLGTWQLQSGAPPLEARTDESGAFSLALVQELASRDELWLTARTSDAISRVVSVRIDRDERAAADLTLAPAGAVSGRVEAAAADLGTMKVVAIPSTQEAGEAELEASSLSDVLGHATAEVGADGRYRLAGLLPGRYSVEVQVAGKARQRTEVVVAAGVEAQASFAFGSTGRLLVRFTGVWDGVQGWESLVVPGRVADFVPGWFSRPKTGATFPKKRFARNETEAAFDAVPSGRVTILVTLGDGLMFFREGVEVVPGEAAETTVAWPSEASLGKVSGRFEKAPPQIVVAVGEGVLALLRVRGGRCEGQLPPGKYRLVPVSERHPVPALEGTPSATATIETGKTAEVVVAQAEDEPPAPPTRTPGEGKKSGE